MMQPLMSIVVILAITVFYEGLARPMSGEGTSFSRSTKSYKSAQAKLAQEASPEHYSEDKELSALWQNSRSDSTSRNAYLHAEDYFAQYVEGGFPRPKQGWQDYFASWRTLDQVYKNCESALIDIGQQSSQAKDLLDNYGNYIIGNVLLGENVENRRKTVQRLLDLDIYAVAHDGDLSDYPFCW